MGDVKIEYRNVRGHVEVFIDGAFYCSADSISEARKETEDIE